jgi:hypothetical protein
MSRDFVVEDWAGRHLEEFASEYAKGPNHDKTIVLHLMGTLERQAKLTLEALWNAQPIEPGAWRIGTVTISRGASLAEFNNPHQRPKENRCRT